MAAPRRARKAADAAPLLGYLQCLRFNVVLNITGDTSSLLCADDAYASYRLLNCDYDWHRLGNLRSFAWDFGLVCSSECFFDIQRSKMLGMPSSYYTVALSKPLKPALASLSTQTPDISLAPQQLQKNEQHNGAS